MRRTTYLIDDVKGFMKNINSDELKSIQGFKVYYTLEENKNGVYYYLEDMNNNKLNLNDLNGYQKQFIQECYNNFISNESISKEFKEFICKLEEPRELKKDLNKRYELFKDYARINKIQESTFEYIKFIDKFSDEFERNFNKKIENNQDEFDKYLNIKIQDVREKNVIKETNSFKFFREELERTVESYSNPEEYGLNNLTDDDLDKIAFGLINDDCFNKIIDDYLQENLQFYADMNLEEESLTQ